MDNAAISTTKAAGANAYDVSFQDFQASAAATIAKNERAGNSLAAVKAANSPAQKNHDVFASSGEVQQSARRRNFYLHERGGKGEHMMYITEKAGRFTWNNLG